MNMDFSLESLKKNMDLHKVGEKEKKELSQPSAGQSILEALPAEILRNEIIDRLDLSMNYVLSKVNRFFNKLQEDLVVKWNPVVIFLSNGWLDLVKWDQEGPAPSHLTNFAFSAAVESGNIAVMEYLKTRNVPIDERSWVTAAKKGDMALNKYLYSLGKPTYPAVVAEAVEKNNMDLVKFLVEEVQIKLGPDDMSLCRAAKIGNREMMEYLMAHGVTNRANNNILTEIATSGDTELLDWALAQGFPTNPQIYTRASYSGKVKVLDWAKAHYIPLKSDVIHAAIAGCVTNSFIQCLRWFIDNGYNPFSLPKPVSTTDWAVSIYRRDFAFFKLAVGIGLPLSHEYYAAAMAVDNKAFISYLEDLKCPMKASAIEACIYYGRWDSIGYLREKGVPWSTTTAAITAQRHSLGHLKRLIAQGCPVDADALIRAIENGKKDIVQYLHEELKMEISPMLAAQAFRVESEPIFNYFLEKKIAVNLNEAWSNILASMLVKPIAIRALLKMGLVLSHEHAVSVLQKANLNLLKWLRRNGCPMDLSKLLEIISAPSPQAWRKKNESELKIISWLKEQIATNPTS